MTASLHYDPIGAEQDAMSDEDHFPTLADFQAAILLAIEDRYFETDTIAECVAEPGGHCAITIRAASGREVCFGIRVWEIGT